MSFGTTARSSAHSDNRHGSETDRAGGAGDREAGILKPFSRTGIAYMLAGDIAEYDPATGITTKRGIPPQTPLMYESATGYRYLVIRVPEGRQGVFGGG